MLGGANGDLQATRTSNGWTFSGDGYTATVGDDGSISHNLKTSPAGARDAINNS